VSLKKITVIGTGSFGGFLCKHLSDLETVKELHIIDDDLVEAKNIRNSIYSIHQVGEYKVDALKEILQENVNVMNFKSNYIEGKTILPNTDLVIDCRDVVCDRGSEIDVRLYISERVLVIDCRKNVKCAHAYKGTYNTSLSKSEINKAAFFAAQIIISEELKNLKENSLIQTVNLNLIPEVMTRAIKESLENKSEVLYEVFDQTERIQRLDEYIKPIMKLNRQENIKVVISDGTLSRLPEENKYAIIPKGRLTNASDLTEFLTQMVKRQGSFTNFILVMKEGHDGKKYIELLEETGAT